MGVICLLVCAAAAAPPVGAVATIDHAVAKVNGSVIWQSELDDRLRVSSRSDGPALLEEMIDERLILRGADEAKITVADSDVDAAFAEIERTNNLTPEQLDELLATYHMTRDRYREDLRTQIRVLRFLAQVIEPKVVISEDDLHREAILRGLHEPLSAADRETLEKPMREAGRRTQREAWLSARKRVARIERTLRSYY